MAWSSDDGPTSLRSQILSFSADFPHSYKYWKRDIGMLDCARIEAKHAHCRVQAWLCWGWCVLSWPMNTCFLCPVAHTESTTPLLPLKSASIDMAYCLLITLPSRFFNSDNFIINRLIEQDCQHIPCLSRRFRILDMTDRLLCHSSL